MDRGVPGFTARPQGTLRPLASSWAVFEAP